MHTYRLIYTWLSDFQNDCVECNSSIAESKCFSELTLVLSIYRDTAPSLSKMTIHVGFFPIVPSIHINILASIKEVDLPPPPFYLCAVFMCVIVRVFICGHPKNSNKFSPKKTQKRLLTDKSRLNVWSDLCKRSFRMSACSNYTNKGECWVIGELGRGVLSIWMF